MKRTLFTVLYSQRKAYIQYIQHKTHNVPVTGRYGLDLTQYLIYETILPLKPTSFVFPEETLRIGYFWTDSKN
jgi:hypothetical protein